MTCQQIVELLPWHARGTLDAAERQRIEEHLESCRDCRAELGEVDAATLLFGGHPSADQILDHARAAPAAPRDLIEAHLAGCAACAEELAMALESRAAMDRAETPTAAGAAADVARVVPLRRPAAPPPLWRAAAVAAALIGLIGLTTGLWSWNALDRQRDAFAERQRAAESRIAELEGELRGLEGARLGVAIHDLWPVGSVLRSSDSGPISLPVDDGPAATLILNSRLEPGSALARLEIRDAEGAVLQSLDGARVGELGTITMSLELADLPRGGVRILLFAEGDGEPVEVYAFELA